MSKSTDVLVIGAGPGGYPAAIRAAQLGKSVTIVEKEYLGGVCLNWGCIPSKALIHASNEYHNIQNKMEEIGINVEDPDLDIEKMMDWKQDIVNNLVNGVEQLLKTNGVEIVWGAAKFLNRNQVKIDLNDGDTETIDFDECIIATGASPISIPGFDIDEEDVVTAKGALRFDEVPDHLVVIGGGIIGMELGSVWAKLGSKVTLVELLPNVLNDVEDRMVRVLTKKVKELGFDIYTNAEAKELTRSNRLNIKVDTEDDEIDLEADKVLVSVGWQAYTEKLGLNILGVETDDRGFIKTDSQQQTNINNIYAIGDCTGAPFLAHRATKQGIVAAEVIAGEPAAADWRGMPGAIYTDPEIAFVGLSEEEAKEEGYNVHVGMASFGASGRAMTTQDEDGFVRVITDQDTGVVLGIEIVGPHASDMISEAALALEMGATAEDIGFTIHPHPTLPEMLMEAAESAEGKAIHVPNRKKR